ncbi:hypothetical protein PHLCEN_2v218 [Hermanssonia centrifuga]|uniref:F-box domain-containing protein n=1 Tax=Hermanssonia centrifuga TaxID=98765 RepID=A0A2R6S6N7_9APHY|nr:hypothetical protein PHLCEN_2v218 [Hermanssonia centrifuga]
MPVHNFPVELFYAIFARVSKQDLASCSLVSWLWQQITLPLLFEKLCIRYSVPNEAIEEGYEASEGKAHPSSRREGL